MARSKKWIRAKKSMAFQAKNLSSQSGLFLIFEARKDFTELRQVFVESPILNQFNLKHYVQIETDASSYAIGRILSQLVLHDLGQWHLIAFFSRKIILVETWYETHNGELLAIVEGFKT